jgi:hypothetical protein
MSKFWRLGSSHSDTPTTDEPPPRSQRNSGFVETEGSRNAEAEMRQTRASVARMLDKKRFEYQSR